MKWKWEWEGGITRIGLLNVLEFLLGFFHELRISRGWTTIWVPSLYQQTQISYCKAQWIKDEHTIPRTPHKNLIIFDLSNLFELSLNTQFGSNEEPNGTSALHQTQYWRTVKRFVFFFFHELQTPEVNWRKSQFLYLWLMILTRPNWIVISKGSIHRKIVIKSNQCKFLISIPELRVWAFLLQPQNGIEVIAFLFLISHSWNLLETNQTGTKTTPPKPQHSKLTYNYSCRQIIEPKRLNTTQSQKKEEFACNKNWSRSCEFGHACFRLCFGRKGRETWAPKPPREVSRKQAILNSVLGWFFTSIVYSSCLH